MIAAVLIAARFLHFTASMLAFGAFAYPGATEPIADERRHRGDIAPVLGLVASIVAAVAALAILLATIAGLGDSIDALGDGVLWSIVVAETAFGNVWLVHAALAAALVGIAAVRIRKPARRLDRIGLIVAGGMLVTTAATGHTQLGEGPAGALHRVADTVHIVAGAVWIGALPGFLSLLRQARETGGASLVAKRLGDFHTVGSIAVLLIVLTGIVNSWLLVGSLDALLATDYGRVLLIKLVFFTAIVAIAADNRFRLVPRLKADAASGADPHAAVVALINHIRAELLLGGAVLFAVAILGTIEPAGSAMPS